MTVLAAQQGFKDRVMELTRPYGADRLRDGLYRMAPRDALDMRFVQPLYKNRRSMLVFDHDDPESSWTLKTLIESNVIPEPNYITTNPFSGRSHLAYYLPGFIATPRGMAFAENVRLKLQHVMGADYLYKEITTRNPLHGGHTTEWLGDDEHTLDSLNRYVESVEIPQENIESRRVAHDLEAYVGNRNNALFEATARYARSSWFRERDMDRFEWAEHIEYMAHALHDEMIPDIAIKLQYKEVANIAKSVVKGIERTFTEQAFTEIQSARAKKKHKKAMDGENGVLARERKALLMKAEGMTNAQIAKGLELPSVGAVRNLIYRAKRRLDNGRS